ncbi:MAG: glycosyltransferase family 2 protein, partial [Bacteroidales bacterium]|nr:glycosyltransferase family 2 protein [Bacteroidales bacterium]
MDLSDLNIAISNTCNFDYCKVPSPKKVNFSSSNEISAFFNDADKEFSLLILENIVLKEDILNKILSKNANFAFLYSEYYDNVNNYIPLCDYTEGSVRDDFDFGKCLIVNNRLAKEAVKTLDKEISLAGFYDFRLQMSVLGKIIKTENFYTLYNIENKDFETAHFAYCEPRNQNYQKEAEKVFTKFLKQINAYIQPVNSEVKDFDKIVNSYKKRLSVIIPVRNRKNTIQDAINSALGQKTDFQFNVIVVDNFSTDGTTEKIDEIKDGRLIHVVPTKKNLGIGGCWNLGVENENCGAFSVQLDSDDVYSNENVLQKI